jgi:succinyl-CoA synthetase beta subunit
MNIHEYQARELFEKFGVTTSKGRVASTPEEAREAAAAIGGGKIVVKAQIHAGGRAKALSRMASRGRAPLRHAGGGAGDRVEDARADARDDSDGTEGRLVSKVLVAEAVDIERELYFAVLLDRGTSAPVIIASTEGGMDIEHVAGDFAGEDHARAGASAARLARLPDAKIAQALGLTGPLLTQASKLFTAVYKLFVGVRLLADRNQSAGRHESGAARRARCEV